jgi:hypothetical protein
MGLRKIKIKLFLTYEKQHCLGVSKQRGRPIIDTAWNAVIAHSAVVTPHEEEANIDLVDEWKLSGVLPHGCKIRPGQQSKASGPVWLCQMYLGGKQRIIGSGSLHQCSLLYDAALAKFEKYRSHSTLELYNTNKEQALSDIKIESGLSDYLDTLEALLLERKLITTSEERKNVQELREVDRRHDRTAAGRLERGLQILADQVESLKISISTIDSIIRSSALSIAAVQSLLEPNSKPHSEDRKVVPSIADPTIFNFKPTHIPTPIGVKPKQPTQTP